MSDTLSGEGPWQVTTYRGAVVLIVIWHQGVRMTFGTPGFSGDCARCGLSIRTYTPDNDTMEVCAVCELVEHV
jgi:hypothetical protein